MTFRASPILGLAVGEGGILCAQVAGGARGAVVQKVGWFTRPIAAATDAITPEQEGALLGAFLKEHGFSATRAVVGVPARWLLSQEKELPPAGVDEAKAILRLHAERMMLADSAPMVADFAGDLRASPPRVLLVALLQSHLDRLSKMIGAAGLSTVAVTSTALAAARFSDETSSVPFVMLGDKSAELVVARNGAPRALRHVSITVRGPSGAGGAASDLRRAMAMAGGSDAGVTVWDGVGLDRHEWDDLASRLKTTVHHGPGVERAGTSIATGALNGAAGGRSVDAYLPAVALAAAGLKRAGLPIDFAHPRLQAVAPRRIGRRGMWSAAFVLLAVVCLASLYVTVQQREAQAVELDSKLKAIADDAKAAQANIDRVAFGRTYFESRPPTLQCLRDVSLAFDYDEPIWATSFTLRDNGRGQLQGRASDQRLVLMVNDRLKANPRFANVQLVDSRDTGGNSREVVFSISFNYVGGP
jgi:hypothetical protein